MPKTDQDLTQNKSRAFKMKSPFRFSTDRTSAILCHCSNYSYRQNIGSCLCSRFKNHKFLVYSIYQRHLPEVLGFHVFFSSTRIPIVLFLSLVLRPSNKKSTVIGNIAHEWPRFCLKERQRSDNRFANLKVLPVNFFPF